jgi:hypothetical protein
LCLAKPLNICPRVPRGLADNRRSFQRHDKVTKEDGPYIANGAMRSLRALYDHARKRAMPICPPLTRSPRSAGVREPRRNTGTGHGPNDISQSLKELCAMENPAEERKSFQIRQRSSWPDRTHHSPPRRQARPNRCHASTGIWAPILSWTAARDAHKGAQTKTPAACATGVSVSLVAGRRNHCRHK